MQVRGQDPNDRRAVGGWRASVGNSADQLSLFRSSPSQPKPVSPATYHSLDAVLPQRPDNLLKSKLILPAKLAPSPTATTGEKQVVVRFRPQDDLLPDIQYHIPAKDIGANCQNERLKMEEDPAQFRPPTADKDGNYIFNLDDPRQGSVNCYVSAYKALNLAEKYLGRKVDWGFKRDVDHDRLWIHPHAGEGLNAFYSNANGSINFLYAEDPRTSSMVDNSASLEVVAHETGHAILDGVRPQYLESLDSTSAGFHEAFGDVIAMLASLSEDDVVNALHQETGGDLSKSNIVSRMGEQLGRAMKGPQSEFVRDACNDQKYKDSHYLPFVNFGKGGGGLEPHQYSGVWTGAMYDVFRVLVAGQRDDSSKTFGDAVKSARDTLGNLVMRGLEFSPVGKINYKEAASAMLKADAIDNDAAHLKPLLAVFIARDIMTQDDAEKFMTDLALTKVLRDSGKLTLPKEFDGQKFLEEKGPMMGMSKDELAGLKFAGVTSNAKGERILTYNEEKKITLTEPEWGAQFQGNTFNVHGGLLLAFDKDDKLITLQRDAVTEDNIEDGKLFLRRLMDFQKNPPIIIRSQGEGEDSGKDAHMEYLLASTRKPVEVVNGEIRRTGIVYC